MRLIRYMQRLGVYYRLSQSRQGFPDEDAYHTGRALDLAQKIKDVKLLKRIRTELGDI